MKEQILILRKEGKTYNQIVEIVKCSKSLVSYHCKPKTKELVLQKQRGRRRKMIKDLVVYKGGKCIKCGYDKCIAALDFHHRDPKQKEFSISGRKSSSFEKLKRESDKCDLICSNCHRELHYLNKVG